MKNPICSTLHFAFLLLPALLVPLKLEAAPKKFSSAVISKDTPGHVTKPIGVDIAGAKHLILEVTSGGDDTAYSESTNCCASAADFVRNPG
jgi:hypothetical protein